MTLNVQDDTGTTTDANAYATVAEFKSYHTARGNAYSSYGDSDIEQALIGAADYLDTRFAYKGRKLNGRSQSTEWPRVDCFDRDHYYVQGVPTEVKEAACEYALRALSGALYADPVRDDSGQLVQSSSETVGPITESVTYVGGAGLSAPRYPAADQKLLKAGFTLNGARLARG